jgi:hypothetical protein
MKSEPYILSRFMNISFIFASLLQLTACKNDTIPTTNTPQYQPSNDSLLAEAEKKDTVATIPAKMPKSVMDRSPLPTI